MRFLLDTNVISAARKPERQDAAFRSFMLDFEVEEAFLSSVSIMEIRFGIQREQGRDREFSFELARWLDEVVLAEFAGRILPFDLPAAIRAGALPTSDKRPSADAMIAATAVHHELTVATRNVAHFEVLGVDCLDPWRYAA
jgi:toxin FitB